MTAKTENNVARKRKKKYELCCMSNFLFSYPESPWRVYIADISSSGLVVGRYETYSTASRKDAEEWMEKNCEDWVICDTP
jgi:hypothetical protein